MLVNGSPNSCWARSHSTLLSGGAENYQTACIQHSQLHEDPTVYGSVRDWVKQPATVLASVR